MAEQDGVGARAGERDTDPGRGFDHTRGDLDQPQADGGELGDPEGCGLRQRLADGPHQPIGGDVEEQPHLVGIGRTARGAVAPQLSLVKLDEVLRLAAGAIERVVDMFGTTGLERGDDEADIEPHRTGFDAGDDTPAIVAPALGGITGLGIAAQHRLPACGTIDADCIRGADDDGVGMQRPVAGKPEHVIDLVGLAPCHNLGAAIMTVAAQRDAGFGPVRLDTPVQSADMAGDLGARRRLAGAQQHRHRPAGGGVVDMERQEAALSVMAIPERQLLAAVDDVDRLVDVERYRRRRLWITGAVEVDHDVHHPHQLTGCRGILPAAHRRLAGQADGAARQLAHRQLEAGIVAQHVEVVGILILPHFEWPIMGVIRPRRSFDRFWAEGCLSALRRRNMEGRQLPIMKQRGDEIVLASC